MGCLYSQYHFYVIASQDYFCLNNLKFKVKSKNGMIKKASQIVALMTILNSYCQNENLKLKKKMDMKNTAILVKANEHVKRGEYEAYLSYLTEDTKWVFVGGEPF